LDETTACKEAAETKPDPGLMQSIEEHQEIPTEEAAVMPVGEPRKRHRVCNLAAERRQKRTERARGNCESRRKLAATWRKVSHCAKVAWWKRNLFKNVQMQRNCGPRKRLTITGRKMTRHATVAWHSENVVRKDWTRNQAKWGTPKWRKDWERLWTSLECSNGIMSWGVEEQLHLRKGRKSAQSIGGWRRHQPWLESMGNGNKAFWKTIGLEFGKRAFGISSGLWRRGDCSLWKDQPFPKRKKKKWPVEREPVL
jgi:hypothetical protein